jgi:two-component system, LuxR family, response regulator FixJ
LSQAQANLFVVDDDESVRASLTRLLRSAGFDCQAYASGDAFLAVLKPDTCGCALLDIHMPGISGLELLEHITRTCRRLGVILITGFDDRDAGRQPGMEGVALLHKPFDDETLLQEVSRALLPR